jgi:hypothetical protein
MHSGNSISSAQRLAPLLGAHKKPLPIARRQFRSSRTTQRKGAGLRISWKYSCGSRAISGAPSRSSTVLAGSSILKATERVARSTYTIDWLTIMCFWEISNARKRTSASLRPGWRRLDHGPTCSNSYRFLKLISRRLAVSLHPLMGGILKPRLRFTRPLYPTQTRCRDQKAGRTRRRNQPSYTQSI